MKITNYYVYIFTFVFWREGGLSSDTIMQKHSWPAKKVRNLVVIDLMALKIRLSSGHATIDTNWKQFEKVYYDLLHNNG